MPRFFMWIMKPLTVWLCSCAADLSLRWEHMSEGVFFKFAATFRTSVHIHYGDVTYHLYTFHHVLLDQDTSLHIRKPHCYKMCIQLRNFRHLHKHYQSLKYKIKSSRQRYCLKYEIRIKSNVTAIVGTSTRFTACT